MTTPPTPAAIFEAALAAWRPLAAQQGSLDLIDRIIAKHRAHLIHLIEQELAELYPPAGQELASLAKSLEEIAEPTQKTPQEIREFFGRLVSASPRFSFLRRSAAAQISHLIDEYLRKGGPVEPFLENIAELIRVGDEHDLVIVRYPDTEDETLAVHIGSLLGVGHEWHVGERGHVLRQDREGVSLHDVELLGDDLDEEGKMTDYVAVKPGRVATTGYNLRQGSISLRHGDRLIRRFFIAPGWDDKHTLGQLRLESYWQHYHMLAKALRRSPLELERTRQLLAYAGVLVTAPACQGRARTVAARTVDRAIHEHKAAAQAIESGQDQLAAERLARVARFVARAAHEVASACASGQDLPPPLAPALYDIPTLQDQPSLFEQTAAPYTDHPELTPERVKAALVFLEEEEGRA